MEDQKKRVLSAIQPTGEIHYGNYFGAIKNWVRLQEKYECVFGVVNYHAMTMPYNADKLRFNTWELIYNLLAIGVKPETLFIQSLVPEHTELSWIFSCFSSFGNVSRMTQFKDKSSQSKESQKDNFISTGLFTYPVLQAADILIYKADYVPVGKDQDQHLELSRDIAQRFNHQVGKDYFAMPETLHTETPKIKSTADPKKKMSKSAGEKHAISVFGDIQRIQKQIKSAVTDAGDSVEGVMSEGVENLFEILKASDELDMYNGLMADYKDGNLKYVDLKEATANALVKQTTLFTERKKELVADKRAVKDQIKSTSSDIRKRAQQTIKEVKELTGLLNVKF